MALTIWAKSNPEGDGPGYPLLPHLLDVAAVGARLQRLIPCPVKTPCSPEWITALVGAHDLGKCTPGFQFKLSSPSGIEVAPDRHDASTIPILIPALIDRGVPRKVAKQLAMAHLYPL